MFVVVIIMPIILTPVLNSQGMKKIRCAIQEGPTEIELANGENTWQQVCASEAKAEK